MKRDTTGRTAVLWTMALALTAAVAARPAAAADEQGDGITVAGEGEVKGKPTVIEIGATISGNAELAADAIVKYRDAKRRATEALEKLMMDNLKIESDGFAVNQSIDQQAQQMMMRGMSTTPGKVQVEVLEQMKLTITGVDTLEPEQMMDTVLRVVDTSRDAGLAVGPAVPTNYYQYNYYYQNENSSLVSFRIDDPAALREQAYELAMDDARAKAQRLADLAGVKLGRILSIKDAVPVSDSSGQNAYMMAAYGMPTRTDDKDLTSSTFSEIALKVHLTVQFAIAEGEPEAGAAAERGEARRGGKAKAKAGKSGKESGKAAEAAAEGEPAETETETAGDATE